MLAAQRTALGAGSGGGGGGGAVYEAAVLADSPYGFWTLGESSGSNAADSSGNSRNGTYENSPTLGASGPVSGVTAATFVGGSSQYVAPSFLFNQATATVEAWIYRTSNPNDVELIAGCEDGLDSSTADKLLYVSDGDLYFYAYDGATKTTTPGGAIPLNEWVYVVGTADGTNLKSWINGSQVGSVACGNTYTGYASHNFFIGAVVNTLSITYFTGSIGMVALYSSALSSTRISAHYAAA